MLLLCQGLQQKKRIFNVPGGEMMEFGSLFVENASSFFSDSVVVVVYLT